MSGGLPQDFHKKAMEYFDQRVAETNAGVTHAAFVAGVKEGTMTFICPSMHNYQIIRGTSRKKAFACYVIFYLAAPLVLIPLWAWQQGNEWLLFGIPISWIASVITAKMRSKERRDTFYGSIGFSCLLAWIFLGRHNYFTVFLTCAFFGSISFLIADDAEERYARESLIEDPEYFKRLLDGNHIMIVRK